jgi:hypothetical protein
MLLNNIDKVTLPITVGNKTIICQQSFQENLRKFGTLKVGDIVKVGATPL